MALRLRNSVVLSEDPPESILDPGSDDPVAREPRDGDLWVNSTDFTLNVFDSSRVTDPPVDANGDPQLDADGNPLGGMDGWIGVTDRTQSGSIVYFSDNQPDLLDMYPALKYLPDGSPLSGENIDISPLPGTMWYDTTNLLLKIFLVSSANSDGAWVSVTSAHYMTQAVQSGLTQMEGRVAALESQLNSLENGGNP